MAPKSTPRKASASSSSKVVRKPDGGPLNFYNGPTEVASKKTRSSVSDTPLTISVRKSTQPRRSGLRQLLLRAVLAFAFLSLVFCPPQVTSSTPAICRPASSYHATLQPYIQPHINSVKAATQARLAPYYEPYRPQVEAVGARIASAGRKGLGVAAPYVVLGRSAVVKNYKRHLAPRVHYATLRLSALAQPHIDNVMLRYRVLIRPYIVRAQAALAQYSAALVNHRLTAQIKTRALAAGRTVLASTSSAYRRAHPEVLRLSAIASKHATKLVEHAQKHSTVAAAAGARFAQEKALPFARKSYLSGKDLGYTGGKRLALEVTTLNHKVIQPQLHWAGAAFNNKLYEPYLAEHLEPLVQPAKLIAKTTARQAVQLGRPVIHYTALALELTARYTMLVYNQVVSPAVSRTATSFDRQVYTPYLAQHLDPVVGPVQAGLVGLALHGRNVATPIFGEARKLALPVWHHYFPAPKEPTLVDKLTGSVAAAADKVESLFVAEQEVEAQPTIVEQFQKAAEAAVQKVEEAFVTIADEQVAEDKPAECVEEIEEAEPTFEVESMDQEVVDDLTGEVEDVSIEDEETVETALNDAHPTPAPVVPGDINAESESTEQLAVEEELAFTDDDVSTDESDEDEDDEDAAFLASLEASDDPIAVEVPEIHEPELPELPDVDDTSAELAEKAALKKEAVSEMRQEIEKKQHDFEEKVRRVGELEEQKLVAELVDIRTRAVSSFPRLAEHWLSTVEKDANKAARSLEKYFRRSNLKWNDIESAVLKGRSRVGGKVDDASEGVNAWLAEVEGREEQAVTKAGDKVDAVAAEAVNVLGLAYAWLDDVTRHDWARYHGITKAAADWHDRFAELTSPETSNAELTAPATDVDGLLEAFREELDQIQEGFAAKIGIAKTNAMLKLDREKRKAQGLPEEDAESPLISIQPIWNAIGGGAAAAAAGAGVIGKGKDQIIDALAQASAAAVGTAEASETETETGFLAQATEQAAALVEAASEAVLGVTTVTKTGFVEQATHAVEVAYDEVAAQAASLSDEASSLLHSATRAAAVAVGARLTPETPAEHVESLLTAVSDSAASLVEAASEGLHEATRAASRAVGATPTPETVGETLALAVEDVKSFAEEGAERVQEALHP